MMRIGRCFRQLLVIATLVLLVCVFFVTRDETHRTAAALRHSSSNQLAYLRFIYAANNQLNKDSVHTPKLNVTSHSSVSNSDEIVTVSSATELEANRDPRHLLSETIDSRKNNIDTSPKRIELFPKQRIGVILQDMRHINRLSSRQSANIVHYMGVTNLNEDSASHFLRCSGLAIIKKHMYNNGYIHIPKHYQTCKKMSFQGHGQVVGLVSFPGSGNSWVRQLLETSTGVYTGSVYCDHAYVEAGMIGEGIQSGNVIAVKSHSCMNTFRYAKLIYIVRNPFDAIFANFNRRVMRHSQYSSSSHVAEIGDIRFDKVSGQWKRTVTEMSNKWSHHVQECLQMQHAPTLVVKYENLKANFINELRKILDFIGYHYTEDDLKCTLQSNTEQFHRKHTTDVDPYSPIQKKNILSQIEIANGYLSQYNISYTIS